jgi:hypothetical protein
VRIIDSFGLSSVSGGVNEKVTSDSPCQRFNSLNLKQNVGPEGNSKLDGLTPNEKSGLLTQISVEMRLISCIGNPLSFYLLQ